MSAADSHSSWLILIDRGTGHLVRCRADINRGVATYQQMVDLEPEFPEYSDMTRSAIDGAAAAYKLLWEEGYERCLQLVFYSLESSDAVVKENSIVLGRSCGLGFALTLLNESMGGELFPCFAATGCLTEDGVVHGVDHVAAKLYAAIEYLPAGGTVVFPEENSTDVAAELSLKAAEKGIRLLPVSHLDEAAAILGMKVSRLVNGSPFRGLEPFTVDHSGLFFGRDEQITEIISQLKNKGTALIIGPSGCGKSSLAQAGVLAELHKRDPSRFTTDYRWAVFCPRQSISGSNLVAGSAQAWQRAGLPDDVLQVNSVDQLVKSAASVAYHDKQVLILLIDQLEELFTQCYSEQQISDFVRYLEALQQAGVWILATIRNDFYPAYQASLLSKIIRPEHQVPLSPANEICLQQMIELPAKFAGLEYETLNKVPLSTQILKDAMADGGALPLLEFALTELYQLRDKQGQLLTYEAYQNFGGVRGSISRAAEKTFDQLSSKLQELVPNVVTKLVRWDETHQRFVSRATALNQFNPAEQDIIKAFASEQVRLLVTDVEEDNPVVRVAHEALISHWPQAVRWLQDDQEFIRWHGHIEYEAKIWIRDDQITARLLQKGKPLTDAESFFSSREEALSEEVKTYIQTSVLQQKKKQTLLAVSRIIIFLFLSGLALIALYESNTASEQKDIAQSEERNARLQLSQAQIAQSRYLLGEAKGAYIGGDYNRALLLALNGLPGVYGGERPYVENLLRIVNGASLFNRQVAVIPHLFDGHYSSVVVSQDGRYMTSWEGGELAVWDLQNYAKLFTAEVSGQLVDVAFVAGTDQLIILSNQSTSLPHPYHEGEQVELLNAHYKVWSIAEQTVSDEHSFEQSFQPFMALADAPKAGEVLFAMDDGAQVLWDLDKKSVLRSYRVDDYLYNPVFSADGGYLALGSSSSVYLFALQGDNTEPVFYTPYDGLNVEHYAFLEQDNNLLVFTQDEYDAFGRVYLWDVQNKREIDVRALDIRYTGVDVRPDSGVINLVADKKLYQSYLADSGISEFENISDEIIGDAGAFAVSSDSRLTLARTADSVLVFSQDQIGDMHLIDRFSAEGAVIDANFIPGTAQIFVVQEEKISLWNYGSQYSSALKLRGGVIDYRVSHDGNKLAVLQESELNVFDLSSFHIENSIKLPDSSAISLLDFNEETVLISMAEEVVQVDLSKGAFEQVHAMASDRGSLNSDKSQIILHDEAGVWLYFNAPNGRTRVEFPHSVVEAKFVPGSESIIVRTADETLEQWHFAQDNWQSLKQFPQEFGSSVIAISSDGGTLASLDYNSLKVWSLNSEKGLPPQSYPYPDNEIQSLEFSSDGNRLLMKGDRADYVEQLTLASGKIKRYEPFPLDLSLSQSGYSTEGNALFFRATDEQVLILDSVSNEVLLEADLSISSQTWLGHVAVSDKHRLLLLQDGDSFRAHRLFGNPLLNIRQLPLSANQRCLTNKLRERVYLSALSTEQVLSRGCRTNSAEAKK